MTDRYSLESHASGLSHLFPAGMHGPAVGGKQTGLAWASDGLSPAGCHCDLCLLRRHLMKQQLFVAAYGDFGAA